MKAFCSSVNVHWVVVLFSGIDRRWQDEKKTKDRKMERIDKDGHKRNIERRRIDKMNRRKMERRKTDGKKKESEKTNK